MKTTNKNNQTELTPAKVLHLLQEGNERFVNNETKNRDWNQQVNATANSQYPFAAILSCSDSRVPTEVVFDQGLGDIFSVRLAGNIATIKAIGSIEFAAKYLGAKLVVVLGHTSCGAVKGACDNLEDGHIHHILEHIRPAVDAEKETKTERNSTNNKFVNNVTDLNVQEQIDVIYKHSAIIRDMMAAGQLAIVGAVYDVQTGKTKFMEDVIAGQKEPQVVAATK